MFLSNFVGLTQIMPCSAYGDLMLRHYRQISLNLICFKCSTSAPPHMFSNLLATQHSPLPNKGPELSAGNQTIYTELMLKRGLLWVETARLNSHPQMAVQMCEAERAHPPQSVVNRQRGFDSYAGIEPSVNNLLCVTYRGWLFNPLQRGRHFPILKLIFPQMLGFHHTFLLKQI